MGTTGYRHAEVVTYRPDEVILEVGSGDGVSTSYLATVGPPVVTIDVERSSYERVAALPNVDAYHGYAEDVLLDWNRPIGFAWLDGYDWPYTGNTDEYYVEQYCRYSRRGYTLSQTESRRSHLDVVELIADHTRVIAFDDTWRTHAYRSATRTHGLDDLDACAETVPPATTPAPALAMDQPIDRSTCGLGHDHPHHDDPGRGWNGKGGTAIPYLLDHGFDVVRYGLGLVVLRRGEDDR